MSELKRFLVLVTCPYGRPASRGRDADVVELDPGDTRVTRLVETGVLQPVEDEQMDEPLPTEGELPEVASSDD